MKAREFFRKMDKGVRLVFLENRGRPRVAAARRRKPRTLRLDPLFRNAPPRVLESVARLFLGNPRARAARRYRGQILGFVQANGDGPARGRKGLVAGPRGRFLDLGRIYDRLNRRHFAGSLDLEVTWSSRPLTSLLGTWDPGMGGRRSRVTINCILDDPRVPVFYIEYLLFHEMLHDIFPQPRRAGRTLFHPPEYRRAERRFPMYEEAETWGRVHLSRVLENSPR